MTTIAKIRRAKGTRKDSLYLDLPRSDRQAVVEAAILSLPRGIYTLTIRGMSAPSIQDAVAEIAGTFAGIDADERTIRGLACTRPDRVYSTFTNGLQEIEIL